MPILDGRQKKHVPALDESLLRLLNLVMHDGANVRVRYRARFETVLQGALLFAVKLIHGSPPERQAPNGEAARRQ
jgi:hypothetical protein